MINEIQVGGYNGLLNKLLSMKEGAPAPTLAPEILAGFILENDRPEWAFLKGERLMGLVATQTTVADQRVLALCNPVGSGLLVVVDQANCMLDDAGNAVERILWCVGNSTLPGNIFGPQPRDSRIMLPAFVGAATSPVFAGSLVGAGGYFGIQHDLIGSPLATGATTLSRLMSPVVLAPGSALGVVNSVAGTMTMFASWHWRERVLDPAETR